MVCNYLVFLVYISFVSNTRVFLYLSLSLLIKYKWKLIFCGGRHIIFAVNFSPKKHKTNRICEHFEDKVGFCNVRSNCIQNMVIGDSLLAGIAFRFNIKVTSRFKQSKVSGLCSITTCDSKMTMLTLPLIISS